MSEEVYEEELPEGTLLERLRAMTWGEGLSQIQECIEAADEIERLREALSMIVEGDAEIIKMEGGVNFLKAGPWGLIARAALGEGKA
jgi:CRISPR/Cas system CMR subunit Cmr4 (Cas7 group RAMP superfamily)